MEKNKAVKHLEIEFDTLEDELRELKRENEDECSKYEAEISSSVVSSPHMDTEKLRLPQKTCASYDLPQKTCASYEHGNH